MSIGRTGRLGHPGFILLAAVATAGCGGNGRLPGAESLAGSLQHVVVVAENEGDSTGTLHRFERTDGQWRQTGTPTPAMLGAAGVDKVREGDRRSPSGVYALPAAFGYAPSPPAGVRLPYIALRAETECVDDPASPQYNRIVNPSELPHGKTWSSSEMMRRDLHARDDLYKWGVVVAYNVTDPVRAATAAPAGSCIFLHIWRGPGRPTVGCTAFAEQAMLELLGWLDPAARPVLVQGTRGDLEALSRTGKLPYRIPEPRAGQGRS